MNTTIKYLIKSILAGIFIGIGGFAYLSIENKILGAFLFSFGLISVIILKQKLFTGVIGYISLHKGHIYTLTVLFGNLIGSFFMGWQCSSFVHEQAKNILMTKLNNSPLNMFGKSIICGMLIYLAVELYKHKQDLLCLILPVVIFILTGSEHCIANMFYCFASGVFDIRILYFIPICVVGNSIGSILIRYIQQTTVDITE